MVRPAADVRRDRLVPGQNHYPPAVALAFALSTDPWVVGQRHVHHPALCRRHRFKRRRAARRSDPSRGPAGKVLQHIRTPLPVVLHVQDDVRLPAELTTDDHSHQELQGMERLTAAADQETSIRTFDFEYKRTAFAFFTHVGFCMYPQGCKEVLEEIADGLLGLLVVFLGRLVFCARPVRLRRLRLGIVFRQHHGLLCFVGGFIARLLPFLAGALAALTSTATLLALSALAALFPAAPPPSPAPVPWRAFPTLLRLWLRLILGRAGVFGYRCRARIRKQPNLDLGRLAAEPQDS